MRKRTPLHELLMRKIRVTDSGCWEWTGKRQTGGHKYGHQRLRKRSYLAHRLSWEVTYGPIPEGMLVCHACDNPPCINPSHLFLGSHSANLVDMHRKGRWTYDPKLRTGAANHQARLTDEKAIAIFNDPRSQEKIAKDYAVAQTTVSRIKRREAWRHIHGDIAC